MDQFHHEPQHGSAEDDGTPNRQDSRDSLFLMADLHIPGKAIRQVRVRNLSSGGLMAEYRGGLPQGLEVELSVRGIGEISGRVAWCAAGRIGVSFDETIDPLLARKPVGPGAKTPVYLKPALSRR